MDQQQDESSSKSSGSSSSDAVMEGSFAPPPPPSSLSNLFGEEDDDDSEEEKEDAAAGVTAETAAAAQDENDSDAEFDDAHAEIVGLSRPEGSEEQQPQIFEEQHQKRSDSYFDMSTTDKRLSTGVHQAKALEQLQYLVPPKTLSVPDIPRPFVVADKGGSNNTKPITLHMTKLPNTLAIIHTAYDRKFYDPHEEEELYGPSTLLSNIIRWRYATDDNGALRRDPTTGKLVRESNARIIQWSDGTKSIQVGQELMDLEEQMSTTASEGVVATANIGLSGKHKNKNKTSRHFLYMSQKAFHLPDGSNGKAAAIADLKHPMTVLECMGPIVSKLSARPSSLQSAAHKALTLQVRRRTVKRAKIAEIVTRADPEAEKAKRIAMKNDLIKEEMGKVVAGGSSAKKGRSSTGRRRSGLHSRGRNYDDAMSEEEEEDRFDSINIGAMKRRAKDTEEVLDYGDSEDEEEWEKSRSWKNQRNKSRRMGRDENDDEEEDEEEVFQEESEEEEEEVAPIRAKNKKAKIGVLDDDEDED